MNAPIYLDYNATTPVDPRVADAIDPYLHQHFGNPSSTHVYGLNAHAAVERAREQVATLIGAQVDEIVFTGCATEANNLAIRGAARALRDKGRHLITSSVEHPAVEQPFQRLSDDGWEVTVIPVDIYGRVDPASLSAALREDTILVSIMHANNEVGTIQPVEEIAAITGPRGILLHTDAAQSAGKIPVSVDELGVDLLTLAGHKFYAPKGVGVLYVRRGTPLQPVLVGAGHEAGLRPGTENVPAIAGLGEAARIASEHAPGHTQQLRQLRDAGGQLEAGLGFARENLEDLSVRAPVAGKLSGFNIEIGQSIARGGRLGQIDDPDSYKMSVEIGEYYLGRVDLQQVATAEHNGRDLGLRISKIYPDVNEGQFKVDMLFDEDPVGLRRGQTLQVRLTLGDNTDAILIPNGAFYQETGGNWVFVVSPDGSEAIRRNVRMGRRNSNFIEVLDGLEPGEKVITSPYTSFVGMDRLNLDDE